LRTHEHKYFSNAFISNMKNSSFSSPITGRMSSDQATKHEPETLATLPTNSQDVEVQVIDAPIAHDAVFGDITGDGPNYRNVSNWDLCCVILIDTDMYRLGG
jgi:hypothetical protein